ncbi:hypothetical protein, partial [Microbacterium sp. 13-71-7]|uniref:hypothetical protein n=1 Tax=Microbacterium sp. 13-71-7 TaxID=1970399 RepID=UPI000BCF5FAB
MISESKSTGTTGSGAVSTVLVSVLLASAPILSLVDVAMGSYAVAILIAVFALYRARLKSALPAIDVLVLVAAVVILVSPYWSMVLNQHEMNVTSPTLGAALAVAYVLPVRWYIGRSRQRFTTYVTILVITGAVLGGVVLTSGVETRISSSASRLFVEFANANFVGAVLSTCASFALYLALWKRYNPFMRAVMVIVAAGLCFVIFQTGSRASLGGVAIALLGMIVLRRAPGIYRGGALLLMFAGFVIGIFP